MTEQPAAIGARRNAPAGAGDRGGTAGDRHPVKHQDYYSVLGVPRTARPDEIKRAYRHLARQHHPDLQTSGERARAAVHFKAIHEAYEVLGSPEKRAHYDGLGREWRAPADIEADLHLPLEEALRGGRRRLHIGGRTIEVDIPPGARHGTVLRVTQQGSSGGGGPAGDLYLHVRLAPHPRYRVRGDDLETDLALWPWQAVLGAEVHVDTPEGPVTLKVPPGTQSGRRLRLRGRGLLRARGGRGDLQAITRIVVPERPSTAERDAYDSLRRHASTPADRPANAGP